MPREFVYLGCCTDLAAAALHEMYDAAVKVTYGTVLRRCRGKGGLLDLALRLRYFSRKDQGLTLRDDVHVRYYRSRYKDVDCYYMKWSGYEFVWIPKQRRGT